MKRPLVMILSDDRDLLPTPWALHVLCQVPVGYDERVAPNQQLVALGTVGVLPLVTWDVAGVDVLQSLLLRDGYTSLDRRYRGPRHIYEFVVGIESEKMQRCIRADVRPYP